MDEKSVMNGQSQVQDIIPVELDYTAQKQVAVNSIESFMESEKVSLICYIDDRADIASSKQYFIANVNAIYNDGKKPAELDFIDWTITPKQRFEKDVSDRWDAYSVPEKKDFFHRLSVFLNDSNAIPALEIEELLGENVKLFSPKEWVENAYKIFEGLEGGQKILCLFDIEFTDEAKLEDGRNGLDLAKHLLDSPHNVNCICGVFSHLFSIEQEDEKRIEFIGTKSLPPKQFYTISKERFAFDPKISAFAEGIKNLLLLPYIEDLKEKSIATFETSFAEAKNKILSISPKTFNQIVQKSSYKEGVWEVSTLFRLFNIISKEENLNSVCVPAVKASFTESIKKIRGIDETGTGYDNNHGNQQLVDLRNSEIYIKGQIVNQLHLPISNGDIFSINDKEFILLVQPCNLAIRTNDGKLGKRNYDYKNAILVPLKTKPKNEYVKSINNELIEFPNSDNLIKFADFSSFKTATLDLIDLVVFNADGFAKIDMNIENMENELIHSPWLKRYVYIHKEIKKFENGLINFNNIKQIHAIPNNSADYNSLRTFIYAPECLKELKLNGADIYDFGTRIFKFKLQRTAHYKSPFSDDLLQKFMQYLSRNAFEHDFTT